MVATSCTYTKLIVQIAVATAPAFVFCFLLSLWQSFAEKPPVFRQKACTLEHCGLIPFNSLFWATTMFSSMLLYVQRAQDVRLFFHTAPELWWLQCESRLLFVCIFHPYNSHYKHSLRGCSLILFMIIVMMLPVSSISIQHMYSFVHCSLQSMGSVMKRGLKSIEIQRDLEMERCIQGTSKTACQLPFFSFFSVGLSVPVSASLSPVSVTACVTVCLCPCSSLPVLLSISVRVRHCLCYYLCPCSSLPVLLSVSVRHYLC